MAPKGSKGGRVQERIGKLIEKETSEVGATVEVKEAFSSF